MNLKRPLLASALALLLSICGASVYAQQPPIPHAFYGTVTINGEPAPVNTTVEARGAGVVTGEGNPIRVTEAGQYGSPDMFGVKLIVGGNLTEGAIITFYVNGTSTGQTHAWHSGEITEIDLSVVISEGGGGDGGGGGGGGGAPPIPTQEALRTMNINMFGSSSTVTISNDGKTLENVQGSPPDGSINIEISSGTTVLDKDNQLPSGLTFGYRTNNPPNPPEGGYIVGLRLDFTPDGATLAPPMTLTITYNPADVPTGVAEKDLVIAYYDDATNKWVEMPSQVNAEANTITCEIEHFTTFAILAYKPPATETPPATQAAQTPAQQQTTPTTTPSGTAQVQQTQPTPESVVLFGPSDWSIIGGIAAVMVGVAVLIYFLLIRRRYRA